MGFLVDNKKIYYVLCFLIFKIYILAHLCIRSVQNSEEGNLFEAQKALKQRNLKILKNNFCQKVCNNVRYTWYFFENSLP